MPRAQLPAGDPAPHACTPLPNIGVSQQGWVGKFSTQLRGEFPGFRRVMLVSVEVDPPSTWGLTSSWMDCGATSSSGTSTTMPKDTAARTSPVVCRSSCKSNKWTLGV